jgi:DNA-binding MarR family transcriptional regulator
MHSPPALGDDLLRIAARLSRWASQSASFDVPSAQARLLALIDESGTARVSALAQADHSSQPTITSQLHRMESSGWVRREADPDDARASLISLTPPGREALAGVRAARAAALEPAIAGLAGAAHERIRAAVEVMTELLRAADNGSLPRPGHPSTPPTTASPTSREDR